MKHRLLYSQRSRPLVVRRENAALTKKHRLLYNQRSHPLVVRRENAALTKKHRLLYNQKSHLGGGHLVQSEVACRSEVRGRSWRGERLCRSLKREDRPHEGLVPSPLLHYTSDPSDGHQAPDDDLIPNEEAEDWRGRGLPGWRALSGLIEAQTEPFLPERWLFVFQRLFSWAWEPAPPGGHGFLLADGEHRTSAFKTKYILSFFVFWIFWVFKRINLKTMKMNMDADAFKKSYNRLICWDFRFFTCIDGAALT